MVLTQVSIKIADDVYRLVKTAASWNDEKISGYISRVLRPIAERDCRLIGAKIDSPSSDEARD